LGLNDLGEILSKCKIAKPHQERIILVEREPEAANIFQVLCNGANPKWQHMQFLAGQLATTGLAYSIPKAILLCPFFLKNIVCNSYTQNLIGRPLIFLYQERFIAN
jgi:hypothetical protein